MSLSASSSSSSSPSTARIMSLLEVMLVPAIVFFTLHMKSPLSPDVQSWSSRSGLKLTALHGSGVLARHKIYCVAVSHTIT